MDIRIIVTIVIIMMSLRDFIFCGDRFDFEGRYYNKFEINEIQPPQINEEQFSCKKTAFIVNKSGELIEIKAPYSYKPGSIISWRIYCGSTNPWAIKETYTRDVKIAGHYHNGKIPKLKVSDVSLTPNPPPLTSFRDVDSEFYLPFSGSLQGKTTYYYWEYVGEFSHILYETTQWIGGCSGTQKDEIYIKIENLVELEPGLGYVLVGSTQTHPYNHYVVPEFKKDLENIGKDWKKSCPKSDPLYYNDASLPWGGLFDININWAQPHIGHRYGFEIDISKKWIRKGNREKAINIMCKYAEVYSEGDKPGEYPHYHIVDRNASKEVFEELEEGIKEEKIKPCCPTIDENGKITQIPKECIDLQSAGQPIPEVLPEQGDCNN